MKAVPGRKTDIKDAEWIADLLQHGLLKASFIPSSEQQAVRDLTRSRMTPTGCVYDFPTSSEGKLPNIVDAQKKTHYTPFKIEPVTNFKTRTLPLNHSPTPPPPSF